VPQTLVYQPDLHVPVRDQDPLNHARQNRPQTEIFFRNPARDLPLAPPDLPQIAMDFPNDARTWGRVRKRPVPNQTPDFSSQKLQVPPKRDQKHSKGAQPKYANNQEP
jgi:hypothetical protein